MHFIEKPQKGTKESKFTKVYQLQNGVNRDNTRPHNPIQQSIKE